MVKIKGHSLGEILFGIVLFGGLGSFVLIIIWFAGIASIHDRFFMTTEYKSEFMNLDGIEYIDDIVLYKFGDRIIKYKFSDSEIVINRTYEIVYVMYENSWRHENNVWKFYEIKRGWLIEDDILD